MNHIKWVAWGVVDVEALNKHRRRNYLKKIRDELSAKGFTLHPGGSKTMPWYRIEGTPGVGRHEGQGYGGKAQVFASKDALKKILTWALHELGEVQGENHVGGADGGLRCAGDEA